MLTISANRSINVDTASSVHVAPTSATSVLFYGMGLQPSAMAHCSGTMATFLSRANRVIADKGLNMIPMDISILWLFRSSFRMERRIGIASRVSDVLNCFRGPQALFGVVGLQIHYGSAAHAQHGIDSSVLHTLLPHRCCQLRSCIQYLTTARLSCRSSSTPRLELLLERGVAVVEYIWRPGMRSLHFCPLPRFLAITSAPHRHEVWLPLYGTFCVHLRTIWLPGRCGCSFRGSTDPPSAVL